MLTNQVPIRVREVGVPVLRISPRQNIVRRSSPVDSERILSINGSTNFNADSVHQAIQSNLTLRVVYNSRKGTHEEVFIPKESFLFSLYEINPTVVRANPILIVGGTTYQILLGLWNIVRPKTLLGHKNLSGPFTTMLYMQRYFDTDYRPGLFLLMAINLNLFVFNLLPLYPLDGAHLAYSLLQNTRYIEGYKKVMLAMTFLIITTLFYILFLDIIKVSVL